MSDDYRIVGAITFLYDNYRDIFNLWADSVNYDLEACFISACIDEGSYRGDVNSGRQKIKELDNLSKKFRKEYEIAAKFVLV